MRIIEYDRRAAALYAREWALKRNPDYYDFSLIGGDCTSFASQCLYAGCGVMNYTPDVGWYYISATDRAAAWSGVEYFYRFLTGNARGGGVGPFAVEGALGSVDVGDFIQLGNAERFYHTLIIVGFSAGEPILAAHSFDAYGRRLSSYYYERLRYLHIAGARMI